MIMLIVTVRRFAQILGLGAEILRLGDIVHNFDHLFCNNQIGDD